MVCGYFYPWTLRNGKFYSYCQGTR